MESYDKETFWNSRFSDKKTIFGTESSEITVECEKVFKEHGITDILIIGIGYGRNGKYFVEKGYRVDGVEISEEAITIGKTFILEINFIKGDILDTELDKKYGAVFCYDMMQLFLKHEREKIIENCIRFCKTDGLIMVSCLSEEDILFGNGNEIEENTFEKMNGLYIHFSNEAEMGNLDKRLETIKSGYFRERSITETEKERSRIYGIYKIK
jgi:SAM-dependent methyltransferase